MFFGAKIWGKRMWKKVNDKEDYKKLPMCKFLNANCLCRHTMEDGTYKCMYKKGPGRCRFEKEISSDLLEKLQER